MINQRNYYRTLHVQPDAPEAVIKASYRTQMQTLKQHPDLGGNEINAAVINEAYATLSNNKTREAYDLKLNVNSQTTSHRSSNHRPSNKQKQAIPTALKLTYSKNESANRELEHTTKQSNSRSMERRSQSRLLKYITATDTSVQVGILSDLSPNGLQLQTPEQLSNNQVIELVCDAFTATAQVKYCKKNQGDSLYKIGVEFLTSHFTQRRGTFFSAVIT